MKQIKTTRHSLGLHYVYSDQDVKLNCKILFFSTVNSKNKTVAHGGVLGHFYSSLYSATGGGGGGGGGVGFGE